MSTKAQSLAFNRGEAVSLPFAVLASQYPNGTSFNWKLQILNEDETVEFEKTGTATVASLSFTVALTTANTLACDEGNYPLWTLWDTTNSRRLAFGPCYVEASQV